MTRWPFRLQVHISIEQLSDHTLILGMVFCGLRLEELYALLAEAPLEIHLHHGCNLTQGGTETHIDIWLPIWAPLQQRLHVTSTIDDQRNENASIHDPAAAIPSAFHIWSGKGRYLPRSVPECRPRDEPENLAAKMGIDHL